MIHIYEGIYNCPEHGDFHQPTTVSGYAADKMLCPKCKKEIPLVRTTPIRGETYDGRLKTK